MFGFEEVLRGGGAVCGVLFVIELGMEVHGGSLRCIWMRNGITVQWKNKLNLVKWGNGVYLVLQVYFSKKNGLTVEGVVYGGGWMLLLMFPRVGIVVGCESLELLVLQVGLN